MKDAPQTVMQAYPDGILLVTPVSDRAFRVRFAPPDSVPRMPESGILVTEGPPPTASITQTPGSTRIALPHARCEIETATGRLRFFDSDGRLLLAESETGRRLTPSRLGDEDVLIARQSFESPEDEHVYGTGCFQDGALDIRALPRRLTQVNTQISLPFILSSKGYGLLWHHKGRVELNTPPNRVALKLEQMGEAQLTSVSTAEGGAEVQRRLAIFTGEITIARAGRQAMLLDIGQKMGTRYRVEIDGKVHADFTNLWLPPTTSFFADLDAGTHSIRVEASDIDQPVLFFGPAEDKTVWTAPVAEAIDYVVIAGPSAADIMHGYRDLFGAARLPPLWTFGYVHSRERFHSSDEIIATLDEFRRRALPLDAIVQDWQYWGDHGWNAMRFDEQNYPDPGKLVEDIHARDARFVLSVWPRIDPTSELGQAFTRLGYFVPGTTWVDFFNPDAVAFYCQNQTDGLGRFGIDGWWQDATEPENDDLDGRLTAAGRGEHVQLTYPLAVTEAVYEAQRAAYPDQRVMILTRSAFIGQHRTGAFTWSGDVGHDFETLKRQVPAGLNMAAAGYPFWTVDAGGFFRPGPGQYEDPAYRECFIRWFQYATFLPMQRVHGFESDTEFWLYGEEVERIARDHLDLRYRLLPYIYSTADQSVRSGLPMIRPLVFDFAGDARARTEAQTFMFGDALHVAPVHEAGATTWPVYLPQNPGGWFDLWTGEHRAGGQVHALPCPIARIPVHVRAGSILPIGPVLQSTARAGDTPLDLLVFPGRDCGFTLYSDDGNSYAYEDEACSRIPLKWDETANVLSVEADQCGPAGARFARELRLHWVKAGISPLALAGSGTQSGSTIVTRTDRPGSFAMPGGDGHTR